MLRRIVRKIKRRSQLSNLIIFIVLLALVYVCYPSSDSGGDSDTNDPEQLHRVARETGVNEEVFRYRKVRYDKYKNRGTVNGPGEYGAAVHLSAEEQKKADGLFKKEAFNIVASDKVSLERTVKDTRDPACRSIRYPGKLPTASVVIIFHNEAWSPLLRTAHSVVNRSPPEMLHEVLLVDDFSDRPELGQKLVDYVYKTWPDNVVKIVRIKKRSGLIRARIAGAEAATGDVLIFLDSHCEANEGWLEPLLNRIHEKHTAVLCPEIDLISADNLHYSGTGAQSVGGFWWSLHFSWRPIPQHERQRRQKSTDPIRLEPMLARIKEKRETVLCPMIDATDADTLEYSGNGGVARGGHTWSLHFTWENIPEHEEKRRNSSTGSIRSPTMAGGLFAVDRKYFFDIGSYDPGMDVWGGENLEISFRTWMCGGTLEFIPCSRVGHIFRASHPYTFPGNKDTHGLNSKRLADVWMDEYKRLFYMHRTDMVSADAGDITERLELRKNLKCKSFKWYLENVYPEKFIPDENVYAWGMVRNPESNLCLDTMGKDEKIVFNLGIFSCQGGKSANEVFSYSKNNEIRREEACLDCSGKEGAKIMLMNCHGGEGNQRWQHDKVKKTIIHTTTGRCLDRAEIRSGGEIIVRTCNGDDSQKWEFEFYF